MEVLLVVLCSNFNNIDTEAPRDVSFLKEDIVAVHDINPPWESFADYGPSDGQVHIWLEIPLQFSHPVQRIADGSLTSSAGELPVSSRSDV